MGSGVSDIVVLAQLAWKAYRSCKDAPESFKNITHEVLSLHALLKELEENLSAQTLSSTRQARLKTFGDGCRDVLEELQSLVDKYESLGTQSKRTWDRMKWGSTDIAELRSRLTSNTLLLTAFIRYSHAFCPRNVKLEYTDMNTARLKLLLRKKLDKFLQEVQEGKHEGSVITAQTVESLSTDEKQTWRIIRKEMEDIGITVAAFDANRDFIMNWFKAAIATGAFEEQALEDASSTQNHEDDLGRLWEDPQHPTASQYVTGSFGPLTIQNIPTRNPVAFGVQSTQIVATQRATSPAFLPTDGLSTSAKIPHMPVIQEAPQKAPMRRKRIPAALIAWMRRYDNNLIDSASEGQEVVVQQLLEKWADVNAKGNYNRTALHLAAYKGYKAVVQRLLEKGADVNAKDNHDCTALHLAADWGHEGAVQQLLEKGADVNAKNSHDYTALHLAAGKGHETVVQWLLEKGADVNAKGISDGRTALHLAAESGHEAVVQQLLEKGADINAKDNYLGSTALHLAAVRGHKAIVQLLLKKWPDINAKGIDGKTALHWAAESGNEAVVQQLLEKGADISAKDNYSGSTALQLAAEKGHRAVVQLLRTPACPPY